MNINIQVVPAAASTEFVTAFARADGPAAKRSNVYNLSNHCRSMSPRTLNHEHSSPLAMNIDIHDNA
jgi:hypothetical protein